MKLTTENRLRQDVATSLHGRHPSSVFRHPSSAIRLPSAVIYLLSSVICLLALPARAATLHVPETWDTAGNVRGWMRSSSSITLSNPSDYLRIGFRRLYGPSSPQESTALATAGASDGNFAGDYVAAGVSNVLFRLMAETHKPSAVHLRFKSGISGAEWYISLPLPDVGTWKDYDVPLVYWAIVEGLPRHWCIAGGGSEEQFNQDIQNIEWMGVYIRRHGSVDVQYYRIDDFELDDTAMVDPRHTDSDGDGMSDWAEEQAGTDPFDPNSKLLINIRRKAGTISGVELWWPGIVGRKYGLWRSTNLFGGFIKIDTNIDAIVPANVYDDTGATGRAPYYYRLQVEIP